VAGRPAPFVVRARVANSVLACAASGRGGAEQCGPGAAADVDGPPSPPHRRDTRIGRVSRASQSSSPPLPTHLFNKSNVFCLSHTAPRRDPCPRVPGRAAFAWKTCVQERRGRGAGTGFRAPSEGCPGPDVCKDTSAEVQRLRECDHIACGDLEPFVT